MNTLCSGCCFVSHYLCIVLCCFLFLCFFFVVVVSSSSFLQRREINVFASFRTLTMQLCVCSLAFVEIEPSC